MSNLARVRRERGLTQADLSLMTRISTPAISSMECGRLKPYPSWKRRLARVLEVTDEELFGKEDSHDRSS